MAQGRSVMLAEDEPMIALMVSDMLEAHGFEVAGLFSQNAQALSFLEDQRPDVAIVDLSLADGRAEPLMRKLRELGIPFFIISGFPRGAADEIFDGVLWLEKPFSEQQLCSTLDACLSKGSEVQPFM